MFFKNRKKILYIKEFINYFFFILKFKKKHQ